jgi:hypothetical protein
MEPLRILPTEPTEEAREHALELIEGAVRLVASGAARRVSLGSIAAAEAVAPSAAAIAQRYGVHLTLQRGPNGLAAILVGPLDVR